MTTPIRIIPDIGLGPLRLGQTRNGPADSFDHVLDIEQADVLVRKSDQTSHSQRISQKYDAKNKANSSVPLAHDSFILDQSKGKSTDKNDLAQLDQQHRPVGLTLSSKPEISGKKDISTNPNPVSQPLPPLSVSSEVSSVSSGSLLSEENLLILDMVSPEVGLRQEILGYGNQQTTQLPLGEIFNGLDFNISVDSDAGVAKGWFIAEDRSFSLDASTRTITIDGRSYPWDENLISIGEGDIFVDSRTLSEWLPIDFSVSRGELTAALIPREKLPLQIQYEREQKRLGLLGLEDMSLRYPLSEAPYKLFSFPIVDVSMSGGGGTISQDTADYQARYSVLAEGEVGYMGAKFFLSGVEDELLNTARVTLNRFDPDAEMFGPIRASQVFAGDISPVNLPVLDRPKTERGAAVSNRELHRTDDFDTTKFEGNMQPGWDVELYRNDSLIQSTRVGGDGRYIFDDIPVFFGVNSFQVRAFGPQGQQRLVDEEIINVGSGMLPTGKFEYNLSASQRDNTVLGITEGTSPSTGDGVRLNGKLGYGVTDDLSVTTGISSVEFNDIRHNYLQMGVSGSLSNYYGQADYIYDTAGGSGLSLQGQTAFGDIKVKARYESFFDFISESRPNSLLQSKAYLGVDGRLPKFGFIPSLAYTLSTENTTYTNSETGRASAKLAGRVNSVYLSNTLNWNYSGTQKDSGRIVDGTFQASGAVGRGRINAGLQYALGEQNEISRYGMSGTWPINKDLSGGASVYHYAGEDNRTSGRINLDWDAGKAILSPSLSYDSEGGLGAFLTLSFSLGRDPVSEDLLIQSKKRGGKGAATAFVYHDINNNRVFDQDDTPLPDVEVVARQARNKSLTNDEGVAYFTGLTAYDPTDIEIDVETLEDPFWEPAVSGTAVVPRAGSVHPLEIPVVTTGEIDGTVYSLDPNGVREDMSHIQLDIVDGDGEVVQSTTSEYDGFYIFQKVFPGTYTLLVSDDNPELAETSVGFEMEIIIDNDGTIASGNDIIFQRPLPEGPKNSPEPAWPPSVKSSPVVEGMEESIAIAATKATETESTSSIHVRPLTINNDGPASLPGYGSIASPASTTISVNRGETEPSSEIISTTNELVAPSLISGETAPYPEKITVAKDVTAPSGNREKPAAYSKNTPTTSEVSSRSINRGETAPYPEKVTSANQVAALSSNREETVPYSEKIPTNNELTRDTNEKISGTFYKGYVPIIGPIIPLPTISSNKNNRLTGDLPNANQPAAVSAPTPAVNRHKIQVDTAAEKPPSTPAVERNKRPAYPPPLAETGKNNSSLGYAHHISISELTVLPPKKQAVQESGSTARNGENTDSSRKSLTTQPVVQPSLDKQQTIKEEDSFSVHLASYKSRESAEIGLNVLRKQLNGIVSSSEFEIKQVDLGEKGIWFRVVYGTFRNKLDADALARRMQPRTDYARSILIDSLPESIINVASTQGGGQSIHAGPYAVVAREYAAMQRRM